MGNYLLIGASSGIGRATALKLAEMGHHVYGTYFQSTEPISKGSITYCYLNATQPDFPENFLPEKLDGFAYFPGSISLKPFHRIAPNAFVEDYELNVVGALKCLQLALPALKSSQAASVLMFSTVAVQSGFPFHSLVAASKGAVEGVTRALAAELAPGIRVNAIAPSITDTPLAGTLLSTEVKKQANAMRHPLKSVASSEQIADVAVFLLTPQSSWMTGQVLHADGGIGHLKV